MKIFFDTMAYVAEALFGETAEQLIEVTQQASWCNQLGVGRDTGFWRREESSLVPYHDRLLAKRLGHAMCGTERQDSPSSAAESHA